MSIVDTKAENISGSQHDGKLLLAAVLKKVGQMSNHARYLRTIDLAVKEMRGELTAMELLELSICTAVNKTRYGG